MEHVPPRHRSRNRTAYVRSLRCWFALESKCDSSFILITTTRAEGVQSTKCLRVSGVGASSRRAIPALRRPVSSSLRSLAQPLNGQQRAKVNRSGACSSPNPTGPEKHAKTPRPPLSARPKSNCTGNASAVATAQFSRHSWRAATWGGSDRAQGRAGQDSPLAWKPVWMQPAPVGTRGTCTLCRSLPSIARWRAAASAAHLTSRSPRTSDAAVADQRQDAPLQR